MNRLRANHYSLAESLHRKKLRENPRCDCGYMEQDIEHITVDCPIYAEKRESLLKKFKKGKLKWPPNLEEILKKPNNRKAKFITEFLKTCELKV